MMRMASKLRPPKFEEGFAKITVVRLKRKDGEAATAEEPRAEFAIARMRANSLNRTARKIKR